MNIRITTRDRFLHEISAITHKISKRRLDPNIWISTHIRFPIRDKKPTRLYKKDQNMFRDNLPTICSRFIENSFQQVLKSISEEFTLDQNFIDNLSKDLESKIITTDEALFEVLEINKNNDIKSFNAIFIKNLLYLVGKEFFIDETPQKDNDDSLTSDELINFIKKSLKYHITMRNTKIASFNPNEHISYLEVGSMDTVLESKLPRYSTIKDIKSLMVTCHQFHSLFKPISESQIKLKPLFKALSKYQTNLFKKLFTETTGIDKSIEFSDYSDRIFSGISLIQLANWYRDFEALQFILEKTNISLIQNELLELHSQHKPLYVHTHGTHYQFNSIISAYGNYINYYNHNCADDTYDIEIETQLIKLHEAIIVEQIKLPKCIFKLLFTNPSDEIDNKTIEQISNLISYNPCKKEPELSAFINLNTDSAVVKGNNDFPIRWRNPDSNPPDECPREETRWQTQNAIIDLEKIKDLDLKISNQFNKFYEKLDIKTLEYKGFTK